MLHRFSRRPPRPQGKVLALGDLIAAACDEAQQFTPDPRDAAALAADAVRRILLRRGDVRLVQMLAAT